MKFYFLCLDELLDKITEVIPKGKSCDEWMQKCLATKQNLQPEDAIQEYLARSPEKNLHKLIESLGKYFDSDGKQRTLYLLAHEKLVKLINCFVFNIEYFTNCFIAVCSKANKILETIWTSDCSVTFYQSYLLDNKYQRKRSLIFGVSPDIPFADEKNDVIILKIDKSLTNQIPRGFLLHEEYQEFNNVSLFGYLNSENGEKFGWEKRCNVYTDKTELQKHIQVKNIYFCKESFFQFLSK